MIGQLHSLLDPTRCGSRMVSIRFHDSHGQMELTDLLLASLTPLLALWSRLGFLGRPSEVMALLQKGAEIPKLCLPQSVSSIGTCRCL